MTLKSGPWRRKPQAETIWPIGLPLRSGESRLMQSIEGKTALVTGAAKRIGEAIARALADHGANVVIHYGTSRSEATDLAAALHRKGVKAWTAQAALDDPAQARALFDEAARLSGGVDFVINSASVFPESTLLDFTPDELNHVLNINAIAPLLLGRALKESQRPGAIVNLLDCMIADYDRKHAAYHLSKRMLHSLTRMMAVEFAPAVRANGVAPGLVLPPVGKDEQYLASLASTNPLNRYGTAEDVAAAVLFLLQSDFITGQVIYVDGGRNLRGGMYG